MTSPTITAARERLEALATVIAGSPSYNHDHLRVRIITLKQCAADIRLLLQAVGVGERKPIESAPRDDTLFLAKTADGRMMIWNGSLLHSAMSSQTPNHLQFPATRWMPLPP